jgi:hypothetical protein
MRIQAGRPWPIVPSRMAKGTPATATRMHSHDFVLFSGTPRGNLAHGSGMELLLGMQGARS